MNDVRKKLTVQERAILSDLWENRDTLKALQSALSHKQLELAQFISLFSTDFNQVMKARGQIEQCQWLIQFLKFNFKESEKSRRKAQEAKVEE